MLRLWNGLLTLEQWLGVLKILLQNAYFNSTSASTMMTNVRTGGEVIEGLQVLQADRCSI